MRWSRRGRFLATGASDGLVLIWQQRAAGSGMGSTPFGARRGPNRENWARVLVFRGHTMDVQDLAWSPDDSAIATASLDRTVRIWSASTAACLRVLTRGGARRGRARARRRYRRSAPRAVRPARRPAQGPR